MNQLRRFVPATLAAMLILAAAFCSPALAEQPSAADATPSGRAPSDAEASGSQTVAWINGEPISYSVIEPAVKQVTQGRNLDQESLATVKALALQKAIEQKLLMNFLKVQNVSVSPQELDSAMGQFRATLAKQNQNYDELVAAGRISDAAIRIQLGTQLRWEKFVQHSATEQELQAFFSKVRERYDGTERRVSHILLRPGGLANDESVKAVAQKAKQLKQDITDGLITFDAAARRHSAGPSRRNGGDLGYCGVKGPLVRPVAEAAFNLQRGEVSDPIPTPFGIHLIKVTDIKPGNKTWREVANQMLPAYASYLENRILAEQLKMARIDFVPNFPHFKRGTTELVMPEPVGSKQ